MNNPCPLRSSIERFAERIGLGNGAVRFPVHEGDLFFADITWRESIPMEPIAHAAHHRQRNGSWRDLSVPEDLKRLILATVGKFGGIEAEFEHGRTVRCILYVHLIPDRRKGR